MRFYIGRPWLWILGVVLAAVAMTSALYWLPDLLTRSPRPSTAADVLSAQNAVRATCVAALVAIGTALTGTIAWRTYVLNRSGQFTERYGAAVGQLGADLMEARIGGIFALESLMRESIVDGPAAVEVLSAFLRNHPAVYVMPAGLLPLPPPGEPFNPLRASQDVETTLVVLGRRSVASGERPLDLRSSNLSAVEANGANLARAWLHRADLSRTHMRGAELRGVGLNGADLRSAVLDRSDMSESRMDKAQLAGASLIEANLQRARIRSADLTAVALYRANLEGADLQGSCLRGARLDGARLRGASLDNADLTGVNFIESDLIGVSMRGARLTGARLNRRGITSEQLAEALNPDAVVWDEASYRAPDVANASV